MQAVIRDALCRVRIADRHAEDVVSDEKVEHLRGEKKCVKRTSVCVRIKFPHLMDRFEWATRGVILLDIALRQDPFDIALKIHVILHCGKNPFNIALR